MEKLTKLDIQDIIEIVGTNKYYFNKNWKGIEEDEGDSLLKTNLKKFDTLIDKLKEL